MIKVKDATAGTLIKLGGMEWALLEPDTGYIHLKAGQGFEIARPFDIGNKNIYSPKDIQNIGYFLNTSWYNGLNEDEKSNIEEHSWGIGGLTTQESGWEDYIPTLSIEQMRIKENSKTISAKVGLLSVGEYRRYSSIYGNGLVDFISGESFWLLNHREPFTSGHFKVMSDGRYNDIDSQYSSNTFSTRPSLYINKYSIINPDGTLLPFKAADRPTYPGVVRENFPNGDMTIIGDLITYPSILEGPRNQQIIDSMGLKFPDWITNFSYGQNEDGFLISSFNEDSSIDSITNEKNNEFTIKGNLTVLKKGENYEETEEPDPEEPVDPDPDPDPEPDPEEPEGLILHYDFRGRSNSDSDRTIVYDLSDNGYNGTLQGFTFNSSNGYTEDGLLMGFNEYVITGNNVPPIKMTSFTYESYFNMNNVDTEDGIFGAVISNLNFFGISEGVALVPRVNEIAIDTGRGAPTTTDDIVFSAPGLSLNSWHHLAITYDGTNFRVYLNGNLLGTRAFSVFQGTKGFSIGRWSTDYSNLHFLGTIAVVRAYDVELSIDDIKANYELLKPEAASIIDSNGFDVFDGTSILENTPEYYKVSAPWNGSSIYNQVQFESNTLYEFTVDVEIELISGDAVLMLAAYNITRGAYTFWNIVSSTPTVGVRQTLKATINTGPITPSDIFEFEVRRDGGIDGGSMIFKVYKDNLKIIPV